MLRVHNTLTGSKEPFEPLVPGKVRMYVCGVTVYDYCHIGHARSALVFDVLRRYLEYSGFVVEFAKNFTDVDDKIIKRANEQGVSCEHVTTTYINAYYEDMDKLGVRRATLEPRATEHIADIVRLVDTLLAKGMAYRVDGDVYFQVDRYPVYGRLSKRNVDDLQAGARVDVDERKRHPMDFALWKGSKPGEPSWDSPWGPGRPGWHIECSAMAMRHLGETFDIHGGGMDLIFPHHENEIAQSCGATGKEFARYWVHNGFVQINQEKMSKSLGNFFTIREIFQKSEWSDTVTGEMLRYFLLSTHYRSPLDFSDQSLNEAKNALNGFYDLFERLNESAPAHGAADQQMQESTMRARAAFVAAMDDDLNTPNAVAALQTLRGEANKALEVGLSGEMRRVVRQEFRVLGIVLGLLQTDTWRFKSQRQQPSSGGAEASTDTLSDEDIADKLAARLAAKRSKNYQLADQLRAELASHGITIEDRPDGTSRWKR
ncbi:MAG: cysteine--tRNA ligase [Nitrospira sp.]|jgi:cysteinyl-tRNA synthetase|uniref:cysteine--tRNA ligase n=1 Tax=Nitrospira sp. ND1 TaxID=1658518 RepID=UPI0009BB806C|nr:cysteine--tRNA ligase [Nitrospira sp. ND1]MBK7418101.1 cysteine--tRNA ligase [Nitrospira sp.]OYT22101.1 MAG: cysteine--tRNA ligase [Nitrospira sp. UW-LDO-02]MBK7484641.1 cysteine--tRNA ligase [Nitrospira sp.]MBK8376917.1 cysteine--tRNA ligase [Nitrospira sp.]MBK9112258.1 cysteine--tRNA ligase [Nitrospira sp.]